LSLFKGTERPKNPAFTSTAFSGRCSWACCAPAKYEKLVERASVPASAMGSQRRPPPDSLLIGIFLRLIPFFVFRFSLKRPNHFGEFQAVFGAFESENDITLRLCVFA
jgi:hypothetical protein